MTRVGWIRYLRWLALVVAFSVACVALSQWQFSRRAEAVARIELVDANYDQAPVSLESLAPQLIRPDAIGELHWRKVAFSGRYLVDQAQLVRNRPLNGQPGFVQLVPFETETGQILAVERGWLATGSAQDSPDLVPLPGTERIEVIARIRPFEADLGRQAPPGQLAVISAQELERAFGDLGFRESYYLRLAEEVPEQPRPLSFAKPSLNEGNHLSYAVQWLIFAAMAFAALFWAGRQELRLRREQRGELAAKPKKQTRAELDAEVEDAL